MIRGILLTGLLILSTAGHAGETLVIADGWRFHTDAHQAGVAGRWDGISFNDAGWTLTDTRGPWEDRGAPGFDGTAWYRKWVDVPAGWERIAVVMPPPLDRADLFVNGTSVARDLSRPVAGTRIIARDITEQVAGRARILLALRVTNVHRHSAGGFPADQDTPLSLVPSLRPLFATREAWAAGLAADWPAGPWPAWLRGGGVSWTAIADPRGQGLGYVGARGQLVPPERDFAVSCWLLDRAAKKLFAMESLPATFTLEDRVLPMPVARARAGRFNLMVQASADMPEGAPGVVVGLGAATVENASDRTRDVDLVLAVTPYSPLGALCDIHAIALDRVNQAVLVNGRPAVIFGAAPDEFIAAPAGTEGSLARALLRGDAPSASVAEDASQRLAGAAAIYHLRIQPYGARTLTTRIFLAGRPDALTPDLVQRVRDLVHKTSWKETKVRWQRLVAGRDRPIVRLSDREKDIQYAFYAAVGHLITAIAGGRLDPADRAAAAAALGRAGHGELAAKLTGTTEWNESANAGAAPAVAAGGTLLIAAQLERAERAIAEGDGEPMGHAINLLLSRGRVAPGDTRISEENPLAWPAGGDPIASAWAGGGLSNPRVAAAYLRLVRDALLREAGGALWLASAIPEEWIRPGKLVEIRWAPTAWGVFPGYALVASPRGLSLRRLKGSGAGSRGRAPNLKPEDLAHPPAGYRWRVPGTRKIRQATVDGGRLREMAPDRVLILPENFRQATVTW